MIVSYSPMSVSSNTIVAIDEVLQAKFDEGWVLEHAVVIPGTIGVTPTSAIQYFLRLDTPE